MKIIERENLVVYVNIVFIVFFLITKEKKIKLINIPNEFFFLSVNNS